MSAACEAQAEKDTHASGAQPRLEERVRERGWRPTSESQKDAVSSSEAARRRAIPGGRRAETCIAERAKGGQG